MEIVEIGEEACESKLELVKISVGCDKRVSVRMKELREIQATGMVVLDILRLCVGVMGSGIPPP